MIYKDYFDVFAILYVELPYWFIFKQKVWQQIVFVTKIWFYETSW